jgi:CheY-like chemotaxis protein
MKILIIDDDPVIAESLKLTLQEAITGVIVEIHGKFSTAYEEIKKLVPDVIILDVYEGTNDIKGNEISKKMWDGHFCPLVIYTARAERNQIDIADHPFVRFLKKASGSDTEVVKHIQEFNPHIQTLLDIHAEISKATRESLRDVCTIIWKEPANDADRRELVGRITRRRMAAHLDSAIDGKPLRAWEQFIFPPAADSLLTGDLLKESSSQSSEVTTYRMILTPSCDLARGGKVTHVLTARSEDIKTFFKAANCESFTADKLKKSLPEKLRPDQVGGRIALPALPSIFPAMTINLKSLELIPLDQISLSKDAAKTHFRVASVDSPFREKMAWAYIQVAGRPGVPDLDVVKFAEELSAYA